MLLPRLLVVLVVAIGVAPFIAEPIVKLVTASVLGDAARNVAVSSTKSMIGHLLGAAGAVEAVFCVLAMRDQVAPPTINLDNPAEGCNLDYVPNVARDMKIEYTLSNSFGFGGTNGSLVFGKLKD